jgi:hypothetical protein
VVLPAIWPASSINQFVPSDAPRCAVWFRRNPPSYNSHRLLNRKWTKHIFSITSLSKSITSCFKSKARRRWLALFYPQASISYRPPILKSGSLGAHSPNSGPLISTYAWQPASAQASPPQPMTNRRIIGNATRAPKHSSRATSESRIYTKGAMEKLHEVHFYHHGDPGRPVSPHFHVLSALGLLCERFSGVSVGLSLALRDSRSSVGISFVPW